jgi:hypothetical protein
MDPLETWHPPGQAPTPRVAAPRLKQPKSQSGSVHASLVVDGAYAIPDIHSIRPRGQTEGRAGYALPFGVSGNWVKATGLDEPARKSPTTGNIVTYITDPWGTRIEIIQRAVAVAAIGLRKRSIPTGDGGLRKIMGEFAIGQSVLRREEPRVLRGHDHFFDELKLADQLRVAIVHSPHAHVDITAIDTRAALQIPGVHAVVTGEDYHADGLSVLRSMELRASTFDL